MERTLIVLPDGTEIFSGAQGTAVMECSLTHSVTNQQTLAPGAVCAAMAELRLWEDSPLSLGAGDALTVYRVDESAELRKVGVFLAEKPVRSGNILQLTAYDRLRLLDKDLGSFLGGLDAWPYSLLELAQLCCGQCGLQLQNEQIPNGDFPVERFPSQGVTGRMLMEWIAQAAGCFCVADENGQPHLGWFEPTDTQLTAADCFAGGLQLETFQTAPIEKVVLRQKDTDIGTAWPENLDGCALCITANPLLAAKDATHLKTVAKTLFDRFQGISYTPGRVVTSAQSLDAGQVVTVTDKAGNTHTFYIMQTQRTAAGNTLTCTGSSDPQLVEAVENRSARGLSGKMLSLQADVDGLVAENTDNRGKLSRLALDISGIRSQVSSQAGQEAARESRLTALEQTSQGLSLSVEKLTTQGAEKLKTVMGYTFDDSGLRIARSGQQMENLLDNTGMYVRRGGEIILQANDRGVTARDVTVGSYLVMGDHARFENYTAGRTACFWLEG